MKRPTAILILLAWMAAGCAMFRAEGDHSGNWIGSAPASTWNYDSATGKWRPEK